MRFFNLKIYFFENFKEIYNYFEQLKNKSKYLNIFRIDLFVKKNFDKIVVNI